MTTLRAPYKTRSWSETEVAALRSMVKNGKDARTIGKELHRSFLAILAKAKKLYLCVEDVIVQEPPFRDNDLMIATISGLLAWIITLAVRAAFGG